MGHHRWSKKGRAALPLRPRLALQLYGTLVPTGRFELPHLAALAPQASVSTSSTTSANSNEKAENYLAGAGSVGLPSLAEPAAGAMAGAAPGAVCGALLVAAGNESRTETGSALLR